MRWTASNSYF
jgi:hypothetical protein